MRFFISLAFVLLGVTGAVAVDTVMVKTNGVLTYPTNFLTTNDIARKTAVDATNAAQDIVIGSKASTNTTDALSATNALQDAALLAVQATNTAQDLLIGSKVGTNDLGTGFMLSNGQWIVTSLGTVTNIAINGKAGTVSDMIASVTNLTADDVSAIPDSTEVEVWSNVTLSASITNVMLGSQRGVVSNGMAWLTNTTTDTSGLATTGALATVSNSVAALQADNTLTNLTFSEGVSNNILKSGRQANVLFKTNYASTVSDTTQWATNAAVTNVNLNNFSLLNVAGLTVTGRLAIGFGLFQSTNDVAAPASTNTWIVFAAQVNGTNYLMGIDAATNRTWIGGAP